MKNGSDDKESQVEYVGYRVDGGGLHTPDKGPRLPSQRRCRVVAVAGVAVGAAMLAVFGAWLVHRHVGAKVADAVETGHPVLVRAYPWIVIIDPYVQDAGQDLVALRYIGQSAVASPVIKFTWAGHHGRGTVPPNIALRRSTHVPVAWMLHVPYSRELMRTPIQIAWGSQKAVHRLAVNPASGKILKVADRRLYSGKTTLWRVSYASGAIPGTDVLLPKATIRMQYLGPGHIGTSLEYAVLNLQRSGGYPEYMAMADPRGVIQQFTAPVPGDPPQLVVRLKWAGHQQNVVLTRRTAK